MTLDAIPQGLFNGSSNDQFQVVLFGTGGLDNTKHTVELTNIPLSTDHQYVDIDFVRALLLQGRIALMHEGIDHL